METLTWSLGGFRSNLISGQLSGYMTGFGPDDPITRLVGLNSRLVSTFFIGQFLGLLYGQTIGLLFLLCFGLTFWLGFGLSGEQLTERLIFSPNEGIQRSRKNGLVVGLLVGSLIDLLIVLLVGLVIGLVVGPVLGLLMGLDLGLRAVIQHYALRIFLTWSRALPWKAIPFLEDATARILLRRVGGGYSFTHRMLLDHFADMGTTPPTNMSPTPVTPP